MAVVAVSRRLEFAFCTGFNAVFVQDRRHGVLAATFALGEQFTVHAWAAVGLSALLVSGFDLYR